MVRSSNRKTNLKRKYGKSSFVENYTHPAARLIHPEDEEVEKDDDAHDHTSVAVTKRAKQSPEAHALTRADQFAPEMLKYWKQRYWLFSLFDGSSRTGQLPLLDAESWFSVTPEPIAARIAQRCRSGTVLDAFCGAGGNAIQFALTCERVIAIDVDPIKLRMAQHNARVYGVEEYITFLQGDWRAFARDWLKAHGKSGSSMVQDGLQGWVEEERHVDVDGKDCWEECIEAEIDVIFLSPPWGGVNYRTMPTLASDTLAATASALPSSDDTQAEQQYYPLEALAPAGGRRMLRLAQCITPNVCLYVPTSTDLTEIDQLGRMDKKADDSVDQASTPAWNVDVEEQWLAGRCKALSCYFGELAEWTEEQDVVDDAEEK